eukprot:TRINITY_DN2515_c0_g1_i4.p1 TRINITY_DN2515_c0_g1~~TRINITY_DN2515_c0_g1_i4.p1  ORF type:complete len:222 (-),score=50.29 TRINITY_DN2515_c0_g1_i4:131-796(-)
MRTAGNLLKRAPFLLSSTFRARRPFSQNVDIESSKSDLSKTVYIKPYTITSNEMVLSITPIKGKFGVKRDYISMVKNGSLLFEFIPQIRDAENRANLDWNNRKNYAMAVKSIGDILTMDLKALKTQDFKIEMTYSTITTKETKTLTIQKTKEEKEVLFTLKVETVQGNPSTYKIPISIGEFVVLQELTKYALPYLIGWNALLSAKLVEDEVQNYEYRPYQK